MKDIWSCWKYQVCSVEKEPHQSSKKMLDDSFPIQIESSTAMSGCAFTFTLITFSVHPVPGVPWYTSHKLACRKNRFGKWRMVLWRKWWLCFHFHHLTSPSNLKKWKETFRRDGAAGELLVLLLRERLAWSLASQMDARGRTIVI